MYFKKIILGFIAFFCLLGGQVFAADLNLNIDDTTTEKDIYEQVYQGRKPQDMYLSIYESTKNDIDKKALTRTAKQSQFSENELKEILNGNFVDDFRTKCESLFDSKTSESLYRCLGIIKDNYAYEKKLVTLESSLKGDANASEIWSDGDLSNSFFDLITDLNIIEIILFGENTFEYPFGDSDNPFLGEEEEIDLAEEIFGENSGSDDIPTSQNQSNTQTKVCRDPDEIGLNRKVWEITPVDFGTYSQAENPYVGGDFRFPKSEDNCGGESLFQGLLCIDEWPCEDFFCIKISTEPQEVGDGGSTKAKFVQELVTTGIKQLNYLKGHTLTIHRNSNERFMISVGRFFDRPISLDVITQGIPVKLVPKDTVFDKEPNILQKLNTTICEKMGFWCYENGDTVIDEASRTINLQTEENDLQSETYAKLNKNEELFQAKLKAVRDEWKKAQKIKHKQNFWDEFRKNLNIMVLYFESMKGAYMKLETTGLEILGETGESCN